MSRGVRCIHKHRRWAEAGAAYFQTTFCPPRIFPREDHPPRSVTGKKQEWVLDCSDSKPAPDFWLRDGDVIEVPDIG